MATKKLKILYLYTCLFPWKSGCWLYRSRIPSAELQQRGHEIQFIVPGRTIHENWLNYPDVVVYGVYGGTYHHDPIPSLKEFKKRGAKIVYDLDDDLSTVNPDNPSKAQVKGVGGQVRDLLRNADTVTTTTNVLKKKFQKYNKNVIVCPNSLDFSKFGKRKNRGGELRIGYTGAASHWGDLSLILDVLYQLQKKHDFMFVLQGMCGRPILAEVYNYRMILRQNLEPEKNEFYKVALKVYDKLRRLKYVHIPFYPPEMYPMILGQLDMDIGLCVLKSNVFNQAKCLTGETLVMTRQGIKRIKDVSALDNIFQNDFEEISANVKYENRNVIEIETKDGYKLKGTPNHRIMSGEQWKTLGSLIIGDEVELSKLEFPKNQKYQEVVVPFLLTKKIDRNWKGTSMMPKITINENWGRLLGYFLGDGSFANNAIRISCSTDYIDIIRDVESLAKEMGLSTATTNKKIQDKRFPKMNKDGKGKDITISSRNLTILLESLGLRSENGRRIIKTPDVIFKSPKSVVREYIRALFEADGTIGRNLSFTSKDERFIRDLQFLLMCFGIKSKVKGRFNKVYKRWYWNLTIKRLMCERFYKEIGFISEKKNKKLFRKINLKLGNNCDECEMKERVEKITYGREDVYDVEVPHDNYYIADGFVSHNSCIKFYEYAATGTVSIASDVIPYNKEVGYCAKNTIGDWCKKLEKLIVNEKFRKDLLGKQLNWVQENRDVKKIAEKWELAMK